MFEKEAEEYTKERAKGLDINDCCLAYYAMQRAYQYGAEFGYNKANEWHYVKDGDLPKEELRPRTFGYYLTASKHKSYKGFVFEVAYFTGVIFTKGGDILDNVIAWKEIELPNI